MEATVNDTSTSSVFTSDAPIVCQKESNATGTGSSVDSSSVSRESSLARDGAVVTEAMLQEEQRLLEKDSHTNSGEIAEEVSVARIIHLTMCAHEYTCTRCHAQECGNTI